MDINHIRSENDSKCLHILSWYSNAFTLEIVLETCLSQDRIQEIVRLKYITDLLYRIMLSITIFGNSLKLISLTYFAIPIIIASCSDSKPIC